MEMALSAGEQFSADTSVKASRRCRHFVLLIAPLLALTACALPRSGPSAGDFARAGSDGSINLVETTMQDAITSREALPTGFDEAMRGAPAEPPGQIGRGDVLTVALFERDGLNLFAPGPDGSSRFEGLVVDPNGAIQLPYVGQIHLAGLTVPAARTAILTKLRHLALSTDVTVAVTDHRSQLVSVQGDVTKPGPVSLGPDVNRLSALLGIAGPTPANLDVATVTVRRGGQSATVRLSDFYDNPADDIALRGGDVVIVRSTPGTVTVLGAAGSQGRVRINRRNYSVVDAVSDSRGLADTQASPAAVYLMRLSEAATAPVPKVYHFDMRNPAQIAVAAAFAVRDGDAVLISNAPFAQSHKVLSAFSGVLTTARSATAIAP